MTNVPLTLSHDELRLVEEACRALASRYWRDSEREHSTTVKQVMIDGALEMERLAERFATLLGRSRAPLAARPNEEERA